MLTGGAFNPVSVQRYDNDGFVETLPELNEHTCPEQGSSLKKRIKQMVNAKMINIIIFGFIELLHLS